MGRIGKFDLVMAVQNRVALEMNIFDGQLAQYTLIHHKPIEGQWLDGGQRCLHLQAASG